METGTAEMAAGQEGGAMPRPAGRASELPPQPAASATRKKKPQGWKCMPFIIGILRFSFFMGASSV